MLKQLKPLIKIRSLRSRLFNNLLKTAKKDKDVVAVMLFGSAARNEIYRDIDVAIVLYPKRHTALKMSDIKLKYAAISEKLDVNVLQQLPLYIQKRAIKEGKLLMCKDDDAFYDAVFESIRAFEDFMPKYKIFLEAEI